MKERLQIEIDALKLAHDMMEAYQLSLWIPGENVVTLDMQRVRINFGERLTGGLIYYQNVWRAGFVQACSIVEFPGKYDQLRRVEQTGDPSHFKDVIVSDFISGIGSMYDIYKRDEAEEPIIYNLVSTVDGGQSKMYYCWLCEQYVNWESAESKKQKAANIWQKMIDTITDFVKRDVAPAHCEGGFEVQYVKTEILKAGIRK